jgi:predicted secreted Zn-dependent protease
MTTIRERADRISKLWHDDLVNVGEIETELRAAIGEFRAECMAKCSAVQTAVNHIDRQRDFDRGEYSAAGHIMRGIREIKV